VEGAATAGSVPDESVAVVKPAERNSFRRLRVNSVVVTSSVRRAASSPPRFPKLTARPKTAPRVHQACERYKRRQDSPSAFRPRLEAVFVTHSHQSNNTNPTAAPTKATARISHAIAMTSARPFRSLFFLAEASILIRVSATISEATASLSSHRSLTA
jgi:hypothetical protein